MVEGAETVEHRWRTGGAVSYICYQQPTNANGIPWSDAAPVCGTHSNVSSQKGDAFSVLPVTSKKERVEK